MSLHSQDSSPRLSSHQTDATHTDPFSTIGCYTEEEPTVREWLRSLSPTRQGVVGYFREIFVFTQWFPRYNLSWLLGDSIAGLTVGFVVIPQAMAYALLATLSPEYGLYTSFVGAALYWLFGTSKDIVIGTTAVGSLLIGGVITSIQKGNPGIYTNEEIAKTTSAIAGIILLAISLLRLGWIIEFIPYIPISAFVTAASITIMSTQFPVLMGIPGINTRQAPYLVIIDALKGLPNTRVDAAIGLTSMVLLYAIRYFCTRMETSYPAKKKTWAIISSMRLTFVMLLYTFISYLVNRNHTTKEQSPFRIVGTISRGFKHAGPPKMDKNLILLILPELPAMLIILVIEHIAIAKSFGRIFGYTVLPSQEMLAQGASNLLGPFLGGYVCTGSFGASAVLSKAGVRTPLAGLFSAVFLILALYVLTAVFSYIPMAALAGLIIHAVANLPTPPKTLYKYWRLSPFELIIWVTGVVVAIFVSLEVSIYVTIVVSLVWLLVRQARTAGSFLGQVHAHAANNGHDHHYHHPSSIPSTPTLGKTADEASRNLYLPLTRGQDASNPSILVEPPYPGVFIFRFTEGLSYINQAQHTALLISQVRASTRRGSDDVNGDPQSSSSKNSNKDKLWSEPVLSPATLAARSHLPPLRSIVLDCSAIDQLDITAIQGLVDARNALDKHACAGLDGLPESGSVEWHFAGLTGRWARKALSVAGFGKAKKQASTEARPEADPEANSTTGERPSQISEDTEQEQLGSGREGISAGLSCSVPEYCLIGEARLDLEGEKGGNHMAVIESVDRPFFHVNLTEAVEAAVRHARVMDAKEKRTWSHGPLAHGACESEGGCGMSGAVPSRSSQNSLAS
ncbi:Sulfate transporter family domain containing protein [Rhypophila decipiens]